MKQKGFTLLEVVVSVAIFSVLILFTVGMLQNVFVGSKQGFLAQSNIDQARSVAFQFVNELRNATTGVDGSYALATAGDNQIIFYSKSANASTINRINYYLSGNTLYKGIVVPAGSPQTYNLANERISTVQSNIVVGQGAIFTYFTDSYNGSGSAISQPVNVNIAKFVKINMTILNQTQQGSQNSFSISEGGTIRNLKTNLGN